MKKRYEKSEYHTLFHIYKSTLFMRSPFGKFLQKLYLYIHIYIVHFTFLLTRSLSHIIIKANFIIIFNIIRSQILFSVIIQLQSFLIKLYYLKRLSLFSK